MYSWLVQQLCLPCTPLLYMFSDFVKKSLAKSKLNFILNAGGVTQTEVGQSGKM